MAMIGMPKTVRTKADAYVAGIRDAEESMQQQLAHAITVIEAELLPMWITEEARQALKELKDFRDGR